MASKIPDTYLWLGLGLCLFAAVRGVSYGLRVVYDLTEISDHAEADPSAAQGTEDDISLSSLQVLATKHTNPEVRKAATALIVERFAASSEAMDLLSQDLVRHPSGTQARRLAVHAVDLLGQHGYNAGVLRMEPQPEPEPARAEPITPHMQENANGRRSSFERRGGMPPPSVVPAEELVGIDPFTSQLLALRGTNRHEFEELMNMLMRGSDTSMDRVVIGGTSSLLQSRGPFGHGFLTESARRRRTRNREAVVVNFGDRPVTQEDIIQRRESGEP